MHGAIGHLGGGPKQPYDDNDGCDHDYEEDEDTGEYVCVHCGDRQPIPLDKLMK